MFIGFDHDWFRDVGVHLTDLKFPAMNSILNRGGIFEPVNHGMWYLF